MPTSATSYDNCATPLPHRLQLFPAIFDQYSCHVRWRAECFPERWIWSYRGYKSYLSGDGGIPSKLTEFEDETDEKQISTAHYQHRIDRAVTMFRGTVVSFIYAKTLRLQSGVYDESKAVTLMSTDVDKIATNIENVLEIWARVAEIGIGIWLLERQLGWVCVAPVIVTLGT